MIAVLVWGFVALGCFFFFAGTVALLRFPNTLSRLHGLTKADNLGLGFVCLGLAVHDGTLAGGLRLLFIWWLAVVAASISAFLIGRRALAADAHDATSTSAADGRP
jgi:multicomponent Na+:H+ antiporter subunit G